jgi:hypothetical protein
MPATRTSRETVTSESADSPCLRPLAVDEKVAHIEDAEPYTYGGTIVEANDIEYVVRWPDMAELQFHRRYDLVAPDDPNDNNETRDGEREAVEEWEAQAVYCGDCGMTHLPDACRSDKQQMPEEMREALRAFIDAGRGLESAWHDYEGDVRAYPAYLPSFYDFVAHLGEFADANTPTDDPAIEQERTENDKINGERQAAYALLACYFAAMNRRRTHPEYRPIAKHEAPEPSIAVYVAAIEHRHGTSFFTGWSEDDVYAKLADYCAEWFDDVSGKIDLTRDQFSALPAREMVRVYFENIGNEFYTAPQHQVMSAHTA